MTLQDALKTAGVRPLTDLNLNRKQRRKARATNQWPTVEPPAAPVIKPVPQGRQPRTFKVAPKGQK